MVTTLEAPSIDKERVLTKEDVLKLIPRLYINKGDYLFYQEYLDREYVLGTVGLRGGGKSGSDAVISIVDFMLRGKPVWSNMKIQCDILVDDEVAREAGLNSGGVAHFESLPLEKGELLKLDERYRNGCLVIEEINVQYSNVRRFMTNTNIDFNEVCQQLRKFKTSMIYNVIDEMFIDSQLRALTDIFIKTYDTAFNLDAMARHKKPGLDFCWWVHSMSGYLNGEQNRFTRTHKTTTAYFHFAPWWGVYDSWQHQAKGTYSLNKREQEAARKAGLSVESSEEMVEHTDEWEWLEKNAIKLKKSGVRELVAWQLWQILELAEHGIKPTQTGFTDILGVYGIHKSQQRNKYGERLYLIDSYSLEAIDRQTDAAARN